MLETFIRYVRDGKHKVLVISFIQKVSKNIGVASCIIIIAVGNDRNRVRRIDGHELDRLR